MRRRRFNRCTRQLGLTVETKRNKRVFEIRVITRRDPGHPEQLQATSLT